MRPGSNFLLKHSLWSQESPREILPTGIPTLDGMITGFPRGAITELFGVTGATTLVQSFLASATRQGEYCAIIDASDCFDPTTAEANGVDLSRLFWVRCGGDAEHALKCADLLIHGGGWGVILLDLSSIQPAIVRRIPISYWYRFRRAIEPSPTVLVVVEREPFVRSCASLALEMLPAEVAWKGTHPSFRYIEGIRIAVAARKPARPHALRIDIRAAG